MFGQLNSSKPKVGPWIGRAVYVRLGSLNPWDGRVSLFVGRSVGRLVTRLASQVGGQVGWFRRFVGWSVIRTIILAGTSN